MSRQLHWEEGQFLQQHHLQQFQKSVFELVPRERKLTWTFAYGVIEAELEVEKLKDYVVQFRRLRVVMPGSGIEVSFPEDAVLRSISLEKAFPTDRNQVSIYLAVSAWSPNQPNAGRDEQSGSSIFRHLVYEDKECRDENTGFNPKSIRFRRVQARLLVEDDPAVGVEKIEVLRVLLDKGKNPPVPSEDPKFSPPCLVVSGSSRLYTLLHQLMDDVHNARKNHAAKVAASHYDYDNFYPRQYENLMRLRTLNRFCSRVSPMIRAAGAGGGIAPFDVYLELGQIAGELSALRLDADDHGLETYDHNNPYPIFWSLCWRIRTLLAGPEEEEAQIVPFLRDGGWWTADMDARHFNAQYYYLCIVTPEDKDRLASVVENSQWFKLNSRRGVNRLVAGFVLRRVYGAVPGLKRAPDRHYFLIDRHRSEPGLWEDVRSEGKLSVECPDQPGFTLREAGFELHMILPPRTTHR